MNRSPYKVLAIVAGLSILGSAGGLLCLYWNSDLPGLITAGLIMILLLKCHLFGRSEVSLVRKRLTNSLLGMHRSMNGSPQMIAIHMSGRLQTEWETLWAQLIREAGTAGLHAVYLDVNAPAFNECYHARWERPTKSAEYRQAWRLEIPLSVGLQHVGHLELAGDPALSSNDENVQQLMAIARWLQRAIQVTLQPADATAPNHADNPPYSENMLESGLSPPRSEPIMI